MTSEEFVQYVRDNSSPEFKKAFIYASDYYTDAYIDKFNALSSQFIIDYFDVHHITKLDVSDFRAYVAEEEKRLLSKLHIRLIDMLISPIAHWIIALYLDVPASSLKRLKSEYRELGSAGLFTEDAITDLLLVLFISCNVYKNIDDLCYLLKLDVY